MDRDSNSFAAAMTGLDRGDGCAEAAVFVRFVDRLVLLAERQFAPWMRSRADAEGVVQSVYRTFFARHARGEFQPDGWDELWGLLAIIALRKCGKRRHYLRAAVRDAGRTRAIESEAPTLLFDREPSPSEGAALAETVEVLMRGLDPVGRAMAERFLRGSTAEEIASEMGCSERTARRLRARLKSRLRRLRDEEGGPP